MSFRKPCHMPFRKLIPPFTLTAENFIQGGTSELLRRPLNVPQNECVNQKSRRWCNPTFVPLSRQAIYCIPERNRISIQFKIN